MSLPGVTLNVLNGNLGIQGANAAQSIIHLGMTVGGTTNALAFYGDSSALTTALDTGEVVESAAYTLSVAGGPVGVMPLLPSIDGTLSSVTHTGTGAMTMAVSAAPHKAIVITITTSGALGTSYFTYAVGSGATSQPVVTPTGHTYLVPGTYCTVTFPTHSYNALETYTISTLGVVTYAANGSGGSDATMTQASSPIDDYQPLITVTKAGALATSQFTYALDGALVAATVGGLSSNVSSPIVTTGGGTYALPNTGIVLTFSGTAVAGDTYAFKSCGPSYSNTDLTNALAVLETTYLSSSYSMVLVVGKLATASAWTTQVSTLATAGSTLFTAGLYARFFDCCPTLGTITSSGSSLVVDAVSTDAALLTARLSTSSAYAAAGAGDVSLTSTLSGLSQRRNAAWVAAARAADVEASQNIGYVGLGAVAGVTYLYRNEQSTPALDAVGFITMRTFAGSVSSGTGLPGFYITDGHTLDTVTSDYYPLTNARVMDRGCTVARATLLPFVNSKIPTTTRNGLVGVITNRKALIIEGIVDGALGAALVFTDPADAVAVSSVVNRTHNILADGNLIIAVAIQPFGYAHTITANIGMSTAA